jgi:hypothetical protein
VAAHKVRPRERTRALEKPAGQLPFDLIKRRLLKSTVNDEVRGESLTLKFIDRSARAIPWNTWSWKPRPRRRGSSPRKTNLSLLSLTPQPGVSD